MVPGEGSTSNDRGGDSRRISVRLRHLFRSRAKGEKQEADQATTPSPDGDRYSGWTRSGIGLPYGGSRTDFHPAVVEACGSIERLRVIVDAAESGLRFVTDACKSGLPAQIEHAIILSLGSEELRAIAMIGLVNTVPLDLPHIAEELMYHEEYKMGWVLVHSHLNHGVPSEQDNLCTQILATLGNWIDRPMIDHWILSKDGSEFFYRSEAPQYLRPDIVFQT